MRFLLIFLISIKSFGTAQAPDYLIIGKDTLKIHSNPLEKYFEKNPIPKGLITSISSGNWRGYIAYFKFIDNKLVVENIYKEEYNKDEKNGYSTSFKSIYKELFGNQENFNCDFYSGLLICPYGKMLEYVHMGYSSIYEKYKLFEINSGINTREKDLSGEEFQKFKIDYFKYFKTTEVYKKERKEFIKMMVETDDDVNKAVESIDGNRKYKKKENKYLQQKEAEFKAEKQVDSFLFLFLDDYIKTLEIPKN